MFAVEHVLYVKNRLLQSALNEKSPYKILASRKPSLYYTRALGFATSVLNHQPKSKVCGKGVPAIHLDGNDNGLYIVECLENKKLVSAEHVAFDEFSFPALDNLGRSSKA